jgi:hypothetical protein
LPPPRTQGPRSPPAHTPTKRRPSLCEKLTSSTLPGFKVPGRRPGSQAPWELFFGNASHRLIAYIYGTRFPANKVYYNKDTIKRILSEQNIGDWSMLLEHERDMRPDITDITTQEVFEIKPSGEEGLQDGTREVQAYLSALNRTADPSDKFSAGKGFEGEVLIQFAQGQHIWHLEWCTFPPGVTQYHWTRSQTRFNSNVAAYQADQWVEISEQELKQYGGWVAQAVEGMVERREQLAILSGAIGVAINVVGEVAMLFISAARTGEHRAAKAGGKVLPMTSRPSPTEPQVQLPRASGM